MEENATNGIKTVLLIEDDPVLIKMYSTKLEASGYKVISALNGEDGLATAESAKADLLILDLMMPKMSGLDVLEKLRKSEKFNQKTPVLILTNLTEKPEQERAKSLGANDFLIKADLVPSEIVEAIKKYI